MVRGESASVGRLIREARQGQGWTQERLAASIGCSKSQLSQMESGVRTVSIERAAAIERALGIDDHRLVAAANWQRLSPEYRLRVQASDQRMRHLTARLKQAMHAVEPLSALRELVEDASSNIDEPRPLIRNIPVINKVAAGYPTEFTDLGYPASVADEYIACPDVTDPDAFAARVVGDSMQPEYGEGEIVVFSPVAPTPAGSDCFVRFERDEETTFKRVFFEDDGRLIRLQPLNPAYPPRVVLREEVAGMYAAVYVLRRIGGPEQNVL